MIRAAVLAILLALPASAQDAETVVAARRAAAALDAAALALQESRGARDRVAALTDTVRAFESGLEALRAGLRDVTIRERALTAELDSRREDVARLTGVLLGMQRSQGPLLLLHPSGPLGTARSGMMVAEVTPALQARAQALSAQLQDLGAMRDLRAEGIAKLSAGLEGAQAARAALSQAIAERADLPERLAADPEALAVLLSGAETLDAFAESLMAVPLAGEGPVAPPFRDVAGQLPLPVEGTRLRGFDQPDAAGVRRPGIILATRPLALVTAPMAATVRYAGPLPDYGNVIILEPQAGHLVVLAGLATVYASAGEVIAAGAALGLMGGEVPQGDALLPEPPESGGATRTETLYIEIREGGAPVDPDRWFAPQRG